MQWPQSLASAPVFSGVRQGVASGARHGLFQCNHGWYWVAFVQGIGGLWMSCLGHLGVQHATEVCGRL